MVTRRSFPDSENLISVWADKPAHEVGKRILCQDGKIRTIRATSSIYGKGRFDLTCDDGYMIFVSYHSGTRL